MQIPGANGILKGIFSGGLSGGISGGLSAGIDAASSGGNFGDAFWAGFKSGAITGGVMGGVNGYFTAKAKNLNVWTGTPNRNKYLIMASYMQSEGSLFDQLWENYPSNSIIHEGPSGGDIFNDHCAINMSEALMESGIELSGGVRCWGNCPSGGGHFVRAQELANALNGKYTVKQLTGKNYYNYIKGRQGIVFFKDYWQRANELGRTGDHIDLWNGSYLRSNGWMATRLRLNFPRLMESFGTSNLSVSKAVWFWEF